MGPETEEGLWYFSLNNRRLWVFKRLREEGLLPNNQVAVRVRLPKSDAERNRYTLENCAVEAKLMREGPPSNSVASTVESLKERNGVSIRERESTRRMSAAKLSRISELLDGQQQQEDEDEKGNSSDENSEGMTHQSNSFSALG